MPFTLMRLLFAIIGIYTISFNVAMACTGIPESLISSPDNLIARSDKILFVRVERATLSVETIPASPPDEKESRSLEELLERVRRTRDPAIRTITYEMRVMSALRGETEGFVNIKSERSFLQQNTSDFNLHKDEKFWEPLGGRTGVESDCQIRPAFEVGYNYLVFLGGGKHVKAFEKISAIENDEWVAYVQDRL